MRFLRMAGTWIPVFLGVVFVAAFLDGTYGTLTWERPLTYAIGFVSLIFGLWALVEIARLPRGEYPTLFMLSLIYQKLFLSMIYASIFGLSAHDILGWIPAMPGAMLFALLVSSTLATSMVNWLLWLGRKHPWLEVEVDPIPFRPIWQRFREGQRRRSRRADYQDERRATDDARRSQDDRRRQIDDIRRADDDERRARSNDRDRP